MIELIRERFAQSAATLQKTQDRLAGSLARAARLIIDAYKNGGGLFLFGNGGSAADAQHIACELVGRFLMERPALKAIALSCDSSVLTCLANDYAYEKIFSRQIEASARAGDVALGLSTSGNSPNVLAALATAREIGMGTIAFTGAGGGKCAALADVLLDVPSDGPCPRIQEAHVVMYHILCELIEKAAATDRIAGDE